MSGKQITVATFSRVIDTQLAKKKLELEGIECFIVNEHIFFMDWSYPRVIGDVKLQVNEANVERAIKILKKTDSMEDVESKNAKPRCPNCNSSDVYCEKFSQPRVVASSLHLAIPFPFLKRKWKCGKCGYHWKAK